MSSWTPILRHCGGLINCLTQFTCFAHFDLCIFRCFITKKHSGAISYDKCPTFCVFKPYPQFLVLSFCLTSMPNIAKIHHDAGNFQFVFFSQMILRITRDQQRHFSPQKAFMRAMKLHPPVRFSHRVRANNLQKVQKMCKNANAMENNLPVNEAARRLGPATTNNHSILLGF